LILIDVNVFVHAHKEQAPRHAAYKAWLEGVIAGDAPYGISELVLSSFLRIVTHPRVFDPPSELEGALAFAGQVLEAPNCVRVAPGRRHFSIFTNLLRVCGARGNLVPDAYLAALAIESGSEFVTADRDFARFPGLTWRHPLDS
jgi:uncharacterized protein